MKTKTKQFLLVMKVLTWAVFFGLCIKTGAILYTYLVSVLGDSVAANDLYMGLDLSNLKSYDPAHYSTMVFLIIIISALKAFMFYYVIKIFMNINYESPFSETIGALIRKISYVAISIGLLASIATKYSEWLIHKGINLPNALHYVYGGAEFIFFAGILFIISLVFKTGIEYQEELDETV
jgi:hypothetical protein